MADEVLDILTRISFEASDAELEQINTALRGQVGLIRTLEERLKQIDIERRKEGQSVQQIRNLSTEYDRVSNALRNLNTGYRQQSGLIGQLQQQQQRLQQQLTDASSRREIERINRALGDTQRQLSELNNLGGGKGPLSGLGEAFKQGLGFAGGFGLVSIIGASVGALKEFGAESFKAAADFEQLTVAFNTLLGSREKATELLVELQKFAASTPFQFTELTSLSKQLLAFGFEAEEIIPTLQRLGDVAGGVGADKLPQIVFAFGQIRANGRLMGQDLNQLVNAGFNPLQIISEKTGKSIATLRKDMEKGKITFKDVEGAFITATSAGGKFFNLMQAQSKTTSGAISNLGDAVDQLNIEIGNTATGPVKALVTGFSEMVNAAKEYISVSPADKIREEQFQLQALVGAIDDSNISNETRNQLITDLRAQYPDFLGKIKDEAITTALLRDRLNDVNEAYERRIKLAGSAAKVDLLQKDNAANLRAQTNAAQVRAAFSDVGIDNYGTVTQAQIKKLSAEQKKKLLNTLKRLDLNSQGFLSKDRSPEFLDGDTRNILAGLNEVYAAELQSLEDAKPIQEALKKELKEQDADKDNARPEKILQDRIARREKDLVKISELTKKATAEAKKSGSYLKNLNQATVDNLQNDAAANRALLAEDKAQLQALQDAAKKRASTATAPDTKGDKARNTLVDELKKKYAELQSKEAELAQKSEVITSASIKKKINAQTEAAIKETNIREEAAIREGKQTKQSAELFNQIREQIRKNGDLQYMAENKAFLDKLEKDQAAFNLNMRKLELQLAQDRLKVRTDDLQLQKDNISEAGRIEEAEINDRLDALRKQASDLAKAAGKDDIAVSARIERDRLDALTAARQRTNQALLDADISFFDKQQKELERSLQIQILIGEQANAERIEEARRAYKAGEITKGQFLRIERESTSFSKTLAELRTQATLQDELNNAVEKYNQLIAERDRQAREGRKDTDPVINKEAVDNAEREILLLQKQIRESKKAQNERTKAERDARIDRKIERVSETNEAIQDIGSIVSAFIDGEQRKTEALISQQQRRVEKAREAAEKGNGAVLKAEEDRLEKLEAKQRKYAATQLAINRALAISQQVLNAAQAVGAVLKAAEGDPYTLAVRVIAAAAAVAGAIFTTVNAVSSANDVTSGFYKGGYTGDGNEKDEAGAVHKREFVFDHKATARIGKDNLEALRYGRLELVPSRELGRSIDYNGMRKEAGDVRQTQYDAMFNTQRIERKLDKLDGVIEAIQGMPVTSVSMDRRGMIVSIEGELSHRAKMRKL